MIGQDALAVATPSGNGNLRRARAVTDLPEAEAAVSPFSAVPFPTESNVLSTVAHELRAPLTALVTSAELLAEDLDGLSREQMREMVSSMHRGALWLHGLVENLLCAATIKEGRLQIHRQPVALSDVVTEVDPVVAPLLNQKRQRLQVKIHGHVPDVEADPRRLGQVLINLILNANKYADADTDIDLRLEARGDRVRVGVADHGPGIPEDAMVRIFEPFYQTGSASRSGKEGVGLGLSVVRSIVEAHGGRVGVGNRPGGGAHFWFEVPIKWGGSSTPNELVINTGGRS